MAFTFGLVEDEVVDGLADEADVAAPGGAEVVPRFIVAPLLVSTATQR